MPAPAWATLWSILVLHLAPLHRCVSSRQHVVGAVEEHVLAGDGVPIGRFIRALLRKLVQDLLKSGRAPRTGRGPDVSLRALSALNRRSTSVFVMPGMQMIGRHNSQLRQSFDPGTGKTTVASISTSAPFGRATTCTAERAGFQSPKYCAAFNYR
jgi:hypothetical protein